MKEDRCIVMDMWIIILPLSELYPGESFSSFASVITSTPNFLLLSGLLFALLSMFKVTYIINKRSITLFT